MAAKKRVGKHRDPRNIRRNEKVPPRPVVTDDTKTKVIKELRQNWDTQE